LTKKPQLVDLLYKLQGSIVFVNLFLKVFLGCSGIALWGGGCVWWCGKNGRHFHVGEVPPLFIF